jgi:hypothetical protein
MCGWPRHARASCVKGRGRLRLPEQFQPQLAVGRPPLASRWREAREQALNDRIYSRRFSTAAISHLLLRLLPCRRLGTSRLSATLESWGQS